MVMISDEINSKFPSFARLIKDEITAVPQNDRYWKAIQTVLELDEMKVKPLTQITLAFARGIYPLVKPLGLNIDQYGEFKPQTPKVVYISDFHLRKFNDNQTENGKLFMIVNLIHEMIHYLDLSVDGKLQSGEPGDKFEDLVFGRQIYPPW